MPRLEQPRPAVVRRLSPRYVFGWQRRGMRLFYVHPRVLCDKRDAWDNAETAAGALKIATHMRVGLSHIVWWSLSVSLLCYYLYQSLVFSPLR